MKATMRTTSPWADYRFAIPDLPRHHVPRSRTLELLASADTAPLVLVTAPAGTGKTSLVAEWVKTDGRSGDTAWLTFDNAAESRRGTRRGFWAGLRRCLAGLGVNIGAAMEPSAAAEAIVDAGRRLTVVLDDHHATESTSEDVDLLLRHAGGLLRLVFVGRRAPTLPLYRYRLTGAVLELTTRELAFDDAEAGELLAALGAPVERTDVRRINAHVGGWAAGLVFAANRLRAGSRHQPARASDPDVDAYLRNEMLDHLPAKLRRFVLATSLADGFDPALAEELEGSEAEGLVREATSSAFAVPSGETDGFHAYPEVVRDFLRDRLAREEPQRVPALLAATSRWLAGRGTASIADRTVGHLVAAGAWEAAATLLLDGPLVGRLLSEGTDGPLHRHARRLPIASRRTAVVRAACLLADGDVVGCGDELTRVPVAAADRALRTSVATLETVRARFAEDAATALATAETARRELGGVAGSSPPGELSTLADGSRGVALLRRGELDLARVTLEDVVASPATRSLPGLHADGLAHLALIDVLGGYLVEAARTATDALALGRSTTPLSGFSTAHLVLALVALDRREGPLAWRHLSTSPPPLDPLTRFLTQHVTAGLEASDGHVTAAVNRLRATAVEAADTDPWASEGLRIEAARLALADGKPELALHELVPLPRHSRDATVARAAAFSGLGDDNGARRALADLHTIAGGLPSPRVRIEALLVETDQRLRHHPGGDSGAPLDTALRLAAPHRLRLPFQRASPAVRRLLAADGRLSVTHPWLGEPVSGAAPAPRPSEAESLTAREREVLGHLTDLLTTEEIAETMFVSVNTIRTHVRGILRKLGVHRRYAAIRRARELGLLDE